VGGLPGCSEYVLLEQAECTKACTRGLDKPKEKEYNVTSPPALAVGKVRACLLVDMEAPQQPHENCANTTRVRVHVACQPGILVVASLHIKG
jgi:hypothetical protein